MMMNDTYLDSTIEAMILAAPEPIPGRKIAQVMDKVTPSRVAEAVSRLNTRYSDSSSSMRIREIAGGYQHYIMPEYVGYVEDLFSRRRKLRLTRAALETVAIVAYRQPVTKSEIEHIRGVASDGVLQNLMEKGMVTIVGRAKTVGKPLQYGTTDEMLKFFGLNSLNDLPKIEEIEELIAAQESRDQTELALDKAIPFDESEPKLNVADGTFDPEARQRQYEEGEINVDQMSPEIQDTESRVLEIKGRAEEAAESEEEPEAEEEIHRESVETGETDNGESESRTVSNVEEPT
jgi:segregation and condensation protein B